MAIDPAGSKVTTRPSPGAGRRSRAGMLTWMAPAGLLVVVVLAWQYLLPLLNVPSYLVPRPSEIATSLFHGFGDGTYWNQTATTLEEILLGFVIGVALGLGIGIVISWSRILDVMITPYMVALNALPKVAVAPLLVIWLGQGVMSKVIIAALIAFFPLLVNVTTGLASADSQQIALMRSLTASTWATFTKVRFPNALPHIFAGLQVAIVLAPVGAIVGEFVGATSGIGYYIQLTTVLVNPAGMFAMFVILIVISLILYEIVRFAGRRLVFWSSAQASANIS